MFTNDLKKGTRVKLRNGWEADLLDSKKGNIRLAKVYGMSTDIGSIYSHDIIKVCHGYDDDGNGLWDFVEHTEKQLQCKDMNEALFG